MASVSDIRRTFLEYFRTNGHEVVDSSPLVPRNDPTLMFTNAGMVQFKNVFTGLEKRAYSRAATSQKCVRAGGKHNDLENVGYTARHHTFFEMLGNFSFGDYFKERAIELAWNLITKEFGLKPDRLCVTVFSEDDEAAAHWKKLTGFPDHKIIRIPTSDNFWAMGDTGPCGPCSEIFYDHGEGIPGGPPGSADADGDRFIEIWNLVFMQFEQLAGGDRISLPKPSIDTGMGLERVAAVLQGVHDNYDVDLFKTLIAASVDLTGVKAEGAQAPSHRVIADHAQRHRDQRGAAAQQPHHLAVPVGVRLPGGAGPQDRQGHAISDSGLEARLAGRNAQSRNGQGRQYLGRRDVSSEHRQIRSQDREVHDDRHVLRHPPSAVRL